MASSDSIETSLVVEWQPGQQIDDEEHDHNYQPPSGMADDAFDDKAYNNISDGKLEELERDNADYNNITNG